ncbi:MAG TPA: rhodanese-like domain-containing protein [Blastocatellia bacterium]|nr:rhodanese-like domain-containing protein [Blastocatellia bacterium]
MDRPNGFLKSSSRIELVGNVAIVIVAVLLIVIMARHYFNPVPRVSSTRPSNNIQIGARFPLANVDWRHNGETLVAAMSEDCGSCRESLPFYRRLSGALSAQGKNVHLVALFSDLSRDSDKYLKDMSVGVDAIALAPLGKLGISFLPAIYLVDGDGLVQGSWIGRLSDEGEAKLLARVGLDPGLVAAELDAPEPQNVAGISFMSPTELRAEIEKRRTVFVLDVDDRSQFREGHIPGAKNIPLDELEARFSNEIPVSGPVVTYCRCASKDTRSLGACQFLKKRGVSSVAVLRRGLSAWQEASLPLTQN